MCSSCHTWDPSSHFEIGSKLNRSILILKIGGLKIFVHHVIPGICLVILKLDQS